MCIRSMAGIVQRARRALIGTLLLASCGGEDPVRVDPKGSIEVTAATSGEHQDTDGYLVTLDDSTRPELNREIGSQGRVVFSDVETGPHTVLLGQVADNCTVTSSNPQRVEVSGNTLSTSAFEVACAAPTGSLRLTIVTDGVDLDPDGYLVTLDNSRGIPVPTNGLELVESVAATNHILEISGIAENCAVRTGNPLEIWIEKDEVLDVQFVIECTPTTGAVELHVVTEGENLDPDGYTADLVADFQLFARQVTGVNGTVTFDRVPPGHYWLNLYDIAGNCLIQVPNPTNFDVSVGETTRIDYRFVCVSGEALSDQIVFESYHEAGQGDLYAIGIDGSGLIRLTTRPNTVDIAPHVSPSGKQIVLTANQFEIHTIDWLGGSRDDITANVACCSDHPAWSPDGTMVAYHSDREQRTEIYVTDKDGTNHTRLTYSASLDLWPSWSLDGSQIAFQSDRASYSHIFIMNADGTGVEQLTSGSSFNVMPAWSPDGRIAFVSDRDGNREIYIMNADGSGLSNLTNDPRDDEHPAWSRDGSRIAFARDASIWLMAGDGSNQVHLTVGISPAYHPSWSP